MNYYYTETTIDCRACLDGTLADMLYKKEILDEVYYDFDGDGKQHPTIVCSSVLSREDVDKFIDDTFAVGFMIKTRTITFEEFQDLKKIFHLYTKSFFTDSHMKPKKIEHIFDCYFSKSHDQQRFITMLQSGEDLIYQYAGLSDKGNVYIGYCDYIEDEEELVGVIENVKKLIEPYGGVLKR